MEKPPALSRTESPEDISGLDTKNKKKDDIIKEIDFILDQHESLRPKWEKLVEELPLDKQLERLEDLARKRREATAPKPYISENLTILDTLPAKAEAFFAEALTALEERSEEVDRGWNGKIMEYPSTDETPTIVYKLLIRSPIGEQNDLLSEASYLADLYELSKINTDVHVGVPKPFYCATISNARVIAMEKVPGASIENIISKGIPVPASIDLGAIEEELMSFVHRINAAGFYHNDLRRGNIMIDLERSDPTKPLAYVVDTGNAKRMYHKGPSEQNIDNPTDRVMLRQAMKILRDYAARQ